MTPTAPPRQIADILATSLAVVFDTLCTERYGRPISLMHVVDEERLSSTVRFRLHREAVRVDGSVTLHQMPTFTVHFASECSGRKSREARLATGFPFYADQRYA
jgi:hypothetical protein